MKKHFLHVADYHFLLLLILKLFPTAFGSGKIELVELLNLGLVLRIGGSTSRDLLLLLFLLRAEEYK